MAGLYNRRDFIRTSVVGGIGLGLAVRAGAGAFASGGLPPGRRVGIIGLDTSHSVAFTKLLNAPVADPAFAGYQVVAAYPKGSNDIASSASRIPELTRQVESLGVEIVTSIRDLLGKVDVVLLNTNDGRLHLEQALPVFQAGKRVFIDKPFAAALPDVVALFEAAARYQVPVFSSSSMRYPENIQDLLGSKTGKVLGADTFSPATLEKTHTDLFWYGIHGVELLFTVMGPGCKQVSRQHTADTDFVTGVWNDGRVGTFRGTRTGPHVYGGTVFGEKANLTIVPAKGTGALLAEITRFFDTGVSPVSRTETLEIYAFMAAAEESKSRGGAAVSIADTIRKAGPPAAGSKEKTGLPAKGKK